MKLKTDINLNLAFEMLKDAMREAKEFERAPTEIPGGNYVMAYAKLSGVTGVVLDYVEDKNPADDIPAGVFTGPGIPDPEENK